MLKLISKYKPVYSYSTLSGGDNPRVNPNILKCPFHSLVGEGVSASGGRLQSDSVQYTHLLPHNIKITTDPWGGREDL